MPLIKNKALIAYIFLLFFPQHLILIIAHPAPALAHLIAKPKTISYHTLM